MPPKFSSQRLVLNKSSSPPKKGQEAHPSAAAAASSNKKKQELFSPSSLSTKSKPKSNNSSESDETDSTHDQTPSHSSNQSSNSNTADELAMSRNSTNESDDDWMNGGDSALDDELSDKSKSTASTDDTFIKQMRSTLPCGMTMTQLMVSIILVPILFLVVYTAIPLASSVIAVNFLSAQRPIADLVNTIVLALEEERFLTVKIHHQPGENMSEILAIFGAVDSRFKTNFSAIQNQSTLLQTLASQRRVFDECVPKLLSLITESNTKYQGEILTAVKVLSSDIAKIRQRITDGTVSTSQILQFYFDKIEDALHIILKLLIDDRVSQVFDQIMMFGVKLRMVNSVAMIRDSVLSLLIGAYDIDAGGSVTFQKLEFVEGMLNAIDRDKMLIESAGSSLEQEDLKIFTVVNGGGGGAASDYQLLRKIAEDVLKVDGNATVLFDKQQSYASYISVDSWCSLASRFVQARQDAAFRRLDQIKEADDLQRVALEEILKMVGAILACVITAAFVIYLNLQEQQRMDATLSATKKLAKAVQRFVPKAQLKMMGVRSVVDVRPSLAVEVANSMLASDIRDFTKLSEEMGNLELFEWLQRYVERMTVVVQEQKGIVSQIIGDALHCLFPQPVNAVKGAINMHVSAEQLNLELVAQGVANLVHIGIGLHFGVVVVGVFGDSTRLSTSVVAKDVNLANQLESLTKSYGTKIICSDAVAGQINIDDYDIRSLGTVTIGNTGGGASSSSSSSKSSKVLIVKIFDIFQTDPVRLKAFKRETLEDFENAIKCQEKDPSTAQKLFEKLLRISKQRGIRDFAVEKLFGELMIRLMQITSGGSPGATMSTSSATPAGSQQTPGGFSSLQHVSSVSASETGIVADETESVLPSRRASDSRNNIQNRSGNSQRSHNSGNINNNNNNSVMSTSNTGQFEHQAAGIVGGEFVSPMSAQQPSGMISNVSSNITRNTSSSVHGGSQSNLLVNQKSSSISSAAGGGSGNNNMSSQMNPQSFVAQQGATPQLFPTTASNINNNTFGAHQIKSSQLPPISSPPSTFVVNNNNNNNIPFHHTNFMPNYNHAAQNQSIDNTPHENAVTAQHSSVTVNSVRMRDSNNINNSNTNNSNLNKKNGSSSSPDFRKYSNASTAKNTASVMSDPILPQSENEDNLLPIPNENTMNPTDGSVHHNNHQNDENDDDDEEDEEQMPVIDVINGTKYVRVDAAPPTPNNDKIIFTFKTDNDAGSGVPILSGEASSSNSPTNSPQQPQNRQKWQQQQQQNRNNSNDNDFHSITHNPTTTTDLESFKSDRSVVGGGDSDEIKSLKEMPSDGVDFVRSRKAQPANKKSHTAVFLDGRASPRASNNKNSEKNSNYNESTDDRSDVGGRFVASSSKNIDSNANSLLIVPRGNVMTSSKPPPTFQEL